jgi:hypothetical protein
MTFKFNEKPESTSPWMYPVGGPAGGSTEAIIATHVSPVTPFVVDYKKGNVGQGSDVEGHAVGPGAGVGSGVGVGTPAYGHVTSTGTKMVINNTAGAETVELTHHSGASVLIDADGAIFIQSSGKKGVGLNAPTGPAVIYAQGEIVLKSDTSVFIETSGNLEFNVGSNFNLNVDGDMITTVKGSMQTGVDGSLIQEVAKDVSTITGGMVRETVAGDKREQVTGNFRFDVGETWDQRVKGRLSVSTEENAIFHAKNNLDISSKNALTVSAQDDIIVQSKSSLYNIATQNLVIESQMGIYSRAESSYVINSRGFMNLEIQGTATIRATDVRMDTSNSVDVRTSGMQLHASGEMDIRGATVDMNSTGAMDLRGSTIDLNAGGPLSPLTGNPAQLTSPRNAADVEDLPGAEFMAANDIIDNLTTEREAPEFPENAKRLSARDMDTYQNDGDNVPGAAKNAASGNRGSNPPVNSSGEFDIPEGPTSNSKSGKQSPYPMLTSLSDPSAKLSKHITVGMFKNLRNAQNSRNRTQIIKRAQNLCYNILDPLYEQFGSRGIQITSGFRPSSRRHGTGGAIDLRGSNREDAMFVAEMAAWVRDNCPWSAILLEANDQGSVHVHLEAAQPGSTGEGFIVTCADSACAVQIPGLNGKQAIVWRDLRNRGKK